ncbi:hypothetical protein [Acinetobacter gerneri]|uniref:Uncharacterized protein n=1 Tax=Acinetobacter gerneri DSM 14967 = CIP 107464 = MTCC 9824 TaxID=1120926 RepID=N8YCM4_9GAMM|nr:hypothetical protein [Acinetobacter gerneri]ENV34512.1 hypothetical protein F960_01250 [Acinetobacter gerneri DSM 14967 = CIP 107464 = MTCC 9824]EPR82934.1 hypothetical protein L289_2659 [Acinetobacter gerneri DSM 14967 = CIP 107464 = MTCC 9824]
MNNMISAQEAISAVQAGKTVLCRYAGDGSLHADPDFSTLDQVPATVFFTPHYEFCIKIEMTELAGIQFTKPAEPHDLKSGQVIYIVMPTCILRTQYDSEHGDICLSVANGFAQLDEENAKLQLQAFGKTFGNMITEIEVKDGFNDKPKKRASRKKTEVQASIIEEQSSIDVVEDNLITGSLIEKDQEDQYQKQLTELLDCAAKANTPDEANKLYRYTTSWTEEQRKPLIDAIHKRLAELNPPEKSESSLMCRINNCQTLEELDSKVIEVQQCDPVIQDRLMSYVNQRRTEISLAADDRMPWDDE